MNRRFVLSLLICFVLLGVRIVPGKLPWPTPFTPAGPLRVLIVADAKADEPLPESQRQIFYSVALDNHVKQLGGVLYPVDTATDMSSADKEWQDLYKRPRKSLPQLIVARGETVTYEDKLPLTIDETLKLIK